MALSRLKVKDAEYEFDPERELTVGRLRQIKAWFGPQLGTYGRFFVGISELDPEAMLCLLWLARQSTGEQNVPTPNDLDDFSLADWEFETVKEDDAKRPPGGDTPTPDSTPTPTNTEVDTSDS